MDLDNETLSLIHETAANVRYLRDCREEDRKDVSDHEDRIRVLERDCLLDAGERKAAARIAAIIAAIISLAAAGLQALATWLRWW